MAEMNYSSEFASSESSHLDRLLAKYAAVWLWTIIFTATTGIGAGFAYFSFGNGRWGPLAQVLLLGAIIGLLLVALAWYHLYLFLHGCLLPMIFDDLPLAKKSETAVHLSRAFQAVSFATINGIVMLVLKLGFEMF